MAKDIKVETLPEAILDLVRRVEKLLSQQALHPRQRILVALAGVPGSGKSTISHAVLTELASRGVQDVAIVPMVCEAVLHPCTFSDIYLGWLPLHSRKAKNI